MSARKQHKRKSDAHSHMFASSNSAPIKIPSSDEIQSDDDLRNINSWEFLLYLNEVFESKMSGILSSRHKLSYSYPSLDFMLEMRHNGYLTVRYNNNKKYGDAYTDLLLMLETDLENVSRELGNPDISADLRRELKNIRKYFLDAMIVAIYRNPNNAVERSYAVIGCEIRDISQTDAKATARATKKRFKEKQRASSATITASARYERGQNKVTPTAAGSILQAIRNKLAFNFKPMTTTSQPSVVKKNGCPDQLRMGTQAQFHRGRVRVSPLFERWLALRAKREKQHVYFNNLQRAGAVSRMDFKRKNREKQMSHALHALERRHGNVAVITLPAHGGMLQHSKANELEKAISYDDAFNRILEIALGKSKDKYQDDFYISDAVKQKLYVVKGVNQEEVILKDLLEKSFRALGFKKGSKLSLAQQQAVYLHFTKYELTTFILDKLRPSSFNFSCQDAIDRASVSFTYFNLIRSIETGQPMAREEFEAALHGRAVFVKGRCINHQGKIIWNAIDAYLEAQRKKSGKYSRKIPEWLPEWRNQNHIFLHQLEKYIALRQKERGRHVFSSMFPCISTSSVLTREVKLGAANVLLTALKKSGMSAAIDEIVVTPLQYKALHDGRLAKVIRELEQKIGKKICFKQVDQPEHDKRSVRRKRKNKR